jgi:hypothetical protein
MTGIEKKSLQHVSNLLGATNSHKVYGLLYEELTNLKIDKDEASRVLKTVQVVLQEEINKAKDAKEWIDSMLKDEQKIKQ